jgi:outer membrane receptor protein involved in Fe transport
LATDAAGEYVAPNLLPGTYTVRTEAKGFRTIERQNFVLEVGKEIRVDLTLQPGEQAQTITVTEQSPLVETTNATLGGTLSNATINDLPLNGRNYQNLLTLRPGVTVYSGGGPWTQSTNGIRPDEMAYMVDGLLNADFYDGRSVINAPSPISDMATILPVDAIQEFNIQINPKAESGWKPGAVVNVGLKSGTNNLHGTAYAFGRDSSWDARNYFNPAPQPVQPVSLKQFGATVGGPIKKDKLFFFTAYESLRSTVGNSFGSSIPLALHQTADAGNCPSGVTGNCAGSLPDAIAAVQAAGLTPSAGSLQLTGCTVGPPIACTGGLFPTNNSDSLSMSLGFPNANTSDNGLAKIDYHINDHHMLSGTFFFGNYSGVGQDRALVSRVFTSAIAERSMVNNYSWIWTPNARWANQVRFGFNRFTQNVVPSDQHVPATAYGINTGVTNPVLGGLPVISISGFTSMGADVRRPSFQGPDPFYDFVDNVSFLRGKHAFKFGGEFARIETDTAAYSSGRGRIFFTGGQTPQIPDSTPLEDLFAGNPQRGTLLIGNPARKLTLWSYAGFAQDDWRVTPKLTLNLGLRYEYITPPSEANNLLGNFDPNVGLVQLGKQISSPWKGDHNNFSPRLGIAWDVTGKGTTVVRAGASVLYATLNTATVLNQVGLQNSPSTSLATVPTGGTGVQPAGGTIAVGAFTYSASQLNWNGQVFPIGTGTISCSAAPCNILGVDQNLRSPYVTNWWLSVQHPFTNNLALEIAYVGNHGAKLTGITDINQINPTTGFRPFNQSCPAPIGNGTGTNPCFSFLKYINWMSNIGESNYNGLQTTLTHRLSHGLSFIAAYTYSHALDKGSLNRWGLLPQNSMRPDLEYASGDFDIRHRFTLTTTYAIPGGKSPLQLLEGWQINSIVTLQGGQPWAVNDTANDFSGSGDFADRWDFFGNPADFKSGGPNPLPYFAANSNSACAAKAQALDGGAPNGPTTTSLMTAGCYAVGSSIMIPPAAGTFGTMGRNIFRDTGFRNWDLSVFKIWKFRERFSAQLRVEFFNVLNHPNFANPYGGANGYGAGATDDPSAPGLFGCGCATPDTAAANPIIGSGSNRAMQLGLKLMF